MIGAFVFVAAIGWVFHIRDQEREARTRVLCEYTHQQQVDKRTDAIEDFAKLDQFKRFFNDPDSDLQAVALQDLSRKLRTRYANKRIPSYCPQHDWPEKPPKKLS